MIQKCGRVPNSSTPVLCMQPGCLLKRPGLEKEQLANILALAIAGNPLDEWIPDSERIEIGEHCGECVLRVLQGRKSFPTEADWLRLIALGRWHQRRHRRRERINAHYDRFAG